MKELTLMTQIHKSNFNLKSIDAAYGNVFTRKEFVSATHSLPIFSSDTTEVKSS